MASSTWLLYTSLSSGSKTACCRALRMDSQRAVPMREKAYRVISTVIVFDETSPQRN